MMHLKLNGMNGFFDDFDGKSLDNSKEDLKG